MKFGVFYEHQLPRPWDDGDEHRLYHDALDQVELADDLGIDYAWEVEHHFLEEYSHSSAPEVFLAAAAQRTEDIRLGHGIKLMPPAYNHPARVAEAVATLDIVSDGRVEWGTGESASRTELEGFGVPPEEKGAMWAECTEQTAHMLDMEPYPGYDGQYVQMPARNVVPKPVQRPHPPLWMACSSRETIEEAARNGVGALCFTFADPEEAESWVDTYYETFEEECVPVGRAVNPNVAMVTGFSCHPDREVARERGAEGFAFFQFALAHYYFEGVHEPGETDIWQAFQDAGGVDAFEESIIGSAIDTPDGIREHLRGFEEAGVDQVIFIQQGGKNRHEHICESLELFAERVMPEFHDREPARLERKRERLAPAVEAAMDRKQFPEPPGDGDRTHVPAYPLDAEGEAGD
ncbi:LLM class flavin-dependent oxidoreductase [Halomarina litorea]|uniref:LLM class flavin-dependent oxidoreductase n=1 Tax=Halomarina litorea TaxID=2961595 RepID=UPI0020C1C283|nr:LLM class flavin-dependent oxidoreductase [Halomarina sp. BCD28]